MLYPVSPGSQPLPPSPSHLELSLGGKMNMRKANFPRSPPLATGFAPRALCKVGPSWRELLGFHAHSWGERDYLPVGDPARQDPEPQPSQREEDERGYCPASWGGPGVTGKPFVCHAPCGLGWALPPAPPGCPLPSPASS